MQNPNNNISNANIKVGVAMTLTAVVMWGGLPILLKWVLDVMDPYTITWFRFSISALILGLYFKIQ